VSREGHGVSNPCRRYQAALANPYGEFFRALPPLFRRVALIPPSAAELSSTDWLVWKAAVARHFSWAVPTYEAIEAIGRYATKVVDMGAGSGYWAWLMRQAGIDVVAIDEAPPPFTWTKVAKANERVILDHPDRTLFLCWPPWGTDMAFNTLTLHRGDYVVYVGEWMGGSANIWFFALLVSGFEAIDWIEIPQWYNRDDRLFVFRRRQDPARTDLGGGPISAKP